MFWDKLDSGDGNDTWGLATTKGKYVSSLFLKTLTEWVKVKPYICLRVMYENI